ncbi:hypothetical protein LZ017_13485 [Pelomonas sp. CA6]|uniref:hypothetical protein n=1 Tax=Pelomonas sp. CA6 TaxID=2907999 RepID=UPI001F4C4860|nr:hypothetical protein [Pelomonas sp. CA6]MCH7344391.1 hypothetical protein [Pelomonas sp. CA6]
MNPPASRPRVLASTDSSRIARVLQKSFLGAEIDFLVSLSPQDLLDYARWSDPDIVILAYLDHTQSAETYELLRGQAALANKPTIIAVEDRDEVSAETLAGLQGASVVDLHQGNVYGLARRIQYGW